ncbi:MAG: sporulation protein YqfC [Candidatus Ornithomonoglobus sp.]
MKKLSEYIADKMRIPKDVIMDLPKVSVCGDKEVYIENHKGLLGYNDNEISVKMNDGIMYVCGVGLRIIAIDVNRMVVNGDLTGVKYEKIGRIRKNVQKNL